MLSNQRQLEAREDGIRNAERRLTGTARQQLQAAGQAPGRGQLAGPGGLGTAGSVPTLQGSGPWAGIGTGGAQVQPGDRPASPAAPPPSAGFGAEAVAAAATTSRSAASGASVGSSGAFTGVMDTPGANRRAGEGPRAAAGREGLASLPLRSKDGNFTERLVRANVPPAVLAGAGLGPGAGTEAGMGAGAGRGAGLGVIPSPSASSNLAGPSAPIPSRYISTSAAAAAAAAAVTTAVMGGAGADLPAPLMPAEETSSGSSGASSTAPHRAPAGGGREAYGALSVSSSTVAASSAGGVTSAAGPHLAAQLLTSFQVQAGSGADRLQRLDRVLGSLMAATDSRGGALDAVHQPLVLGDGARACLAGRW